MTNSLQKAQQQVLRLSIHQGLTHEQIATVTEMPLGTVKTHARRGLIQVRDLLKSGEQETSVGVQS